MRLSSSMSLKRMFVFFKGVSGTGEFQSRRWINNMKHSASDQRYCLRGGIKTALPPPDIYLAVINSIQTARTVSWGRLKEGNLFVNVSCCRFNMELIMVSAGWDRFFIIFGLRAEEVPTSHWEKPCSHEIAISRMINFYFTLNTD